MPNPAKYITILLLLLCSLQSNAQSLPKKIRKRFTNCYSQTDSLTVRPFETSGYYIFEVSLKGAGTFENRVIFYPDGTYVGAAHGIDGKSFEEFARELKVSGNKKEMKWIGQWGIYKIEHGEIIAQSVFDPGCKWQHYKWSITETHYEIVDSRTLKVTYHEYWDGNGKGSLEAEKEGYPRLQFSPGRYMPFADLPVPDSWLKKIEYLKCP